MKQFQQPMEKNTPQQSRTDLNVSSTTDYPHGDPVIVSQSDKEGLKYEVEVSEFETHSGPLPSPHVLRGYDDIAPGAAERIIRMAEKQLDHNINYDTKSLKCVDNSEKRGQWFGFILTILLIGSGIWATAIGNTTVACIIFGTATAAVAGAFVSNMLRIRKHKEDTQK